MGEAFIVRRGGETYKLPVLNPDYPQDVTVTESADGSAIFTIKISEPGSPAEYAYQWYVNGEAVDGATNAACTIYGLTSTKVYVVYCEVTNKAGVIASRAASLIVTSAKPEFTYSGSATTIQDGAHDWRIKFLTSGNLTFTSLGCLERGIDVFCVGGGGGGSTVGYNEGYGGGGGGGYTTTTKKVQISAGVPYEIIVGGGGAGVTLGQSKSGGNTSAFGCSANGGKGGAHAGGDGGSGGARGHHGEGGARGGTNGGNGGGDYHSTYTPGKGQGTTTREFGETGATLYSGGGTGMSYNGGWLSPIDETAGGNDGYYGSSRRNGTTNRGGGGSNGGSGGSGIVVIRNAR